MKKSILSIIAIVLLVAMLMASCSTDGDVVSSNSSTNDSVSDSSHSDDSNASITTSSSGAASDDASSNDSAASNESSNGNASDSTSSETNSYDEPDPDVSSSNGDDISSNASNGEASNDNTSSNGDNASDDSHSDISSNESSDETVSNTGTQEHKHDYSQQIVVPPTCTEQGYTKYICNVCKDSYIGNYKALAKHNMVFNSMVNPTETTRGKSIYKCSYGCGYTETTEYYSYNELGKLIAGYALQYINEYRVQEGAPKLITSAKINEFCEYRAQQALQGGDHVGHNRADACLAAEATKFGGFADYTNIGMGSFWATDGQEAWTNASYSNNDCIKVGDTEFAMHKGQYIANLSYASKPHWAYVGGASSSYKDFVYVGIGLSVRNCYIVVCDYNPDEMGYKYSYYDENGNLHEEWVKP